MYLCLNILSIEIADKESETELIQQLRDGVYNGLLPETPQQLRRIINELTVKRPYVPKPMLNGLLHIKLRLLEEHKKSTSLEPLNQSSVVGLVLILAKC